MLRAMMTVSGLTLVSRILGFLRDIMIARFVGTGPVADAFVAAFRFPNMFRRVFGEGAYNAAFVPLFGRKCEEHGSEAAVDFARNTFSALVWVVGGLTLIAIPCMHWIMMAVVPGFLPKFEKDLGGSGHKSAFYECRVDVKGAREIYFQITGKSEAAVRHWSARTRVEDMHLLDPEGKQRKLLVSLKNEGFPMVTSEQKEIASEGLILTQLGLSGDKHSGVGRDVDPRKRFFPRDGEEVLSVIFGMDPKGLARIELPPDHGMESFVVRVAIRAVDASAEIRESTLRIFRNHPENFDLTVALSRIMFCYLFFMALVAHLSGVLNTFRHFAVPAGAPILLNLVMLGSLGLIWFMRWEGDLQIGKSLAWGVALAGFLQFLVLWTACSRAGAAMLPRKPLWNPELKKLLFLMGPGVIAAGIQQVNLLVGGIIASFQQGAISTLYYADRVNQLPLGMIGIALGIVLLPEVTRRLRSGRASEAADSILRGMELAMLLTLPAAAAMVAVHEPLIQGLFAGEKFTAADVAKTGLALAGFALGLPGYVLIKVLQPAYFAREDTKRPMMMAGVAVAVNIACSLLFFHLLRPAGYGHVGIAIATAISAWVNVVLLWRGMDGFVTIARAEWKRLLRMALASLLMGGVVYLAGHALESWLSGMLWQRIVALALIVGTGITVYGVLALSLGATSVSALRSSLMAARGRGNS